MTLSSDYIDAVMYSAKLLWHCAIRLQITAGWGCTVLEIFERDAAGPQTPLRRILL